MAVALDQMLEDGRCVISELYPSECAHHLGHEAFWGEADMG